MNIDVLFNKAETAPDKGNWRGSPSEREKAQTELLELMNKKDHWILLAKKGVTPKIREAAAKRWIDEGLGGDEAVWLFRASKDASVKRAIVEALSTGKKRSVTHVWNIATWEPGSPESIQALHSLITIANEDEEKRATATHALRSIASTEKGQLAVLAFNALFELDLKEEEKSGKEFQVLKVKDYLIPWSKDAKNEVVKASCKKLLQ